VLDTAQVKSQIRAQIERQTGADVATVTCPQDVKAAAGDTFTCRATGSDGSTAAITVVQTNGDGELRFDTPLLHTTETEDAIERRIGGGARVDCPELVLVRAGVTFSCSLKGGKNHRVEVTLTDAKGTFDYELKR